jgi:hypothetical protein
MRTRRVLGIFVLIAGISLGANAQASRTWVSGVGDDVNPCSRTAPCKTFAGAISKTAVGGEIDVLDPAGYGAVTITKSITIEGADFVASVLVSGTNAIVIQAGTGTVHLRNLRFNGIGTGLNAIRVLSAARVTIEGCTIFDFTQGGIDIEPNALSKVAVSDTSIRNVNGFGVQAKPAMGGGVLLSLDHVRITGTTGTGFAGAGSAVIVDGASADIVNSVLSESVGAGLFVRNGSDAALHGTSIFRNGTGISVGDAGGGTVDVYGSSVVTNSNGIAIISGAVVSHGNNAITFNGGTQAVSSNIGTQ